jgi:hypothetical protein
MIKINPTIFGDSPKHDEMYGELGYVGALMHFVWEIVKLEKDSTRGEIAWCKITNPDALIGVVSGVKKVSTDGEAVLLLKDLVPANMKTTLDYTVQEFENPNAAEIAQLFKERKKMQGQGKSKEHADMKKNWKAITDLRAATDSKQVRVLLPKQNLVFTMSKKELPDDSDESILKFKQILSGKLRAMRSERKVIKDVKTVDVFGVAVEKRGGVFLESGSLLKAYEESLKTSLETPKKPVDKDANYVGIEIEFIYRGNYYLLKKQLISHRLHRFVDLTQDGSLRPCHGSNNYQSLEMRIISKVSEIELVLTKLSKVFNHPSIDAYVNRSCGLHVHTDMRNRNVGLAYKNFVRIQNLLRGAQPVGRINNTHCRANTNDTIDFKSTGSRGERYSVINALAYDKHKTLEIRIHEGSVECRDIYNWVMFIDSIASHTQEIPVNSITTAAELVSTYGIKIPMESINYVDTRINKFQSLSAG